MAIPIAVPIVGGVAALGLVGLRIRAVQKKKATAAVSTTGKPLPVGPIPPAPNAVSQPTVPRLDPNASAIDIAKQLGVTPPPGATQPPGTRAPTLAELIFSIQHGGQGLPPGVSEDMVSAEMAQAAFDAVKAQEAAKIAVPNVPNSAVQGQQAVVTTNDPAPSGDLIIRSAPSLSAPQIGGAEKGGIVTVIESSDVTFAQIQWDGGSRLPAATGFARKAFLKLV